MKGISRLLGAAFLALALCAGWTTAAAAELDRGVLQLSRDWVRKGETVEVTFSLDGARDIQDGLNVVAGTLTYDQTVFQPLTADAIQAAQDWDDIYYNPETGRLVAVSRAGDKDGGEVFRFALQARASLSPSRTAIAFSDVTASEGQGDLTPAGANAPVQVISDQVNAGTTPSQPSGQTGTSTPAPSTQNEAAPTPAPTAQGSTVTPQATRRPAGSGSVSEPQASATPSPTPSPTGTPVPTVVPATGENAPASPSDGMDTVPRRDRTGFFIAGGILLVILLLVLLATRCRWLNKKAGRILAALLLVGLVAVLFGGIAYGLQKKGDLNDDSQVDYADVALFARHLVGLESLEDRQRLAADLDSDNRLTVTDLALLIRMVEKTVRYEVTLTSAAENRYFEKNDPLTLTFQAQVSYDAAITGVTVNGQSRPVTRSDSGNIYTLTLDPVAQAGVQPCHITAVTLSGGQEVAVDFTDNVEVLKDIPAVQDLTVQELVASAQMQADFTIQDPDHALTGATLELTREGDSGVEVLQTETLEAGSNTVVLNVPEDTACQLSIYLPFDRTTGELPQSDTDYTGSANHHTDVQLHLDYDFTFDELKTLDGSRETDRFGKGQPVTLQFRSTNRTDFEPVTVTVDGVNYPAEAAGEDGLYRVTLPGFDESGERTLTVERVVLANGKVFELTGQTAGVEIQKTLPTVSGLTLRETEAGRWVEVSFTLSDPDQAATNRKVAIRDADGGILKEESFTGDAFSGTLDLNDALTPSYTVEVTADCDLSTDHSGTEPGRVLGSGTFEALPRVRVTDFAADRTYYEKNEEAVLTCRLETNRPDGVRTLTVNNLDLPVQTREDGLSEVCLPLGSQPGALTLELSQAVLAEDTVVLVSAQQQVEVLRDLPAIRNYQVTDDFDGGQVRVTFTVEDPDGALTGGTAVLTADEDNTEAGREAITAAGSQTLTFQVVENKAYTLTVTLAAERSTDGTQTGETGESWPIQMIRDYQLTVSDLTAEGPDGSETVYVEKGGSLTIRFTSENKTQFVPAALVSGGVEYPLTAGEDGSYTLTLPAGTQAGPVDFTADALRMNNGKLLSIDGGRTLRYEVLRDAPAVADFSHEKTEEDTLRVQFTLQDADGALESARVTITDETGQQLLDESAAEGPNEKTVPLGTGERYTVTVYASYDLDSGAVGGDANHYTDEAIFTQEVTASRTAIELKDVVSETLYRMTADGPQKVDQLDITGGLPADTENYYAVIGMKDLPDFYAGIREFRLDEEAHRLYAVLDRDSLIAWKADGSKTNIYAFPVAYRQGETDHPLIESAEELFRQMASNLNGTFTLDCDLDASGVTGSYAVPGTFTGTLNGNGHTIYNLPAGLFQKISKGTVRDLVLEDAAVTTDAKGILAGTIDGNAQVEQVFLVDCTLRNAASNMVGGFTGSLTNATIRQSAAINLTIQADNTIGGMVGQTYAGSRIEDCYVTGRLQGTRVHNLGARVGGITGWHSGTAIEHCLTKVTIVAPKNDGNGGIIGGPSAANSSVIRHCVSLGGGNAYRIAGFTAALGGSVEEVYEYAASSSPSNITDDNAGRVKTVSDLTRDFYEKTLGLDSSVWYLDLAGGNILPTLQGDPQPKNETEAEIEANANGIPSYRRLRAQPGYRADRETAYANMAKLMPFADTADWVAYGNALPAGSTLLTRAIDKILPLDETGGLVTGLDLSAPDAVQRIRLIYTDGRSEDLPVTFRKTQDDLLAIYRLTDAGLPYQFRGYLKDLSALGLDALVQQAAALDYDGGIAALTTETEGRLYRDYYNESVHPKLEQVVRSLVLSQQEYPAYTASPAVQQLVAQRLQAQDLLPRTLYAYNYYDKWYNISFGGVNLSDLLFFSGDLVAPDLSARMLTDSLLNTTSALRGTNKTYDFYTQVLQPHTNRELLDLLATLAKGAGYDDPSDWFAAEFDGILVEQPALSQKEGIEYRIWHAFETLGNRKQIVLPIMTAPQEDMYLLSVPSQMIIGSMNRYNTYQDKDGGERDRMRATIESYAERYGHFYGISANWITNAPAILNGFVNIQYDTRFNFPANPVTNQGEQVRGVTQDPVIKWVYEAIGAYSDMGGVGAYANGTDVYCVAYPAIGTDFTFYALTHETAHNQDGKYFYAGYGRRSGTGAEAHADGNIAQQIEDGSMVFNISRICDPASDVTNNLSYTRIETAEQVKDYYQKMFDTSYVIDYLAGQAFLRLTPEEQARVAVQITEETQGNSFRAICTRLTADQLRAMDLDSMDDLWENHIAIKTPGNRASGSGAYGYESFYEINWYQPHCNDGVADSSSFKRLGQEMLGIGGYEDGYVTYISGKSKTDLQALRTITNDPDITWKDYKMGRYDYVAQNLDNIPYFEPEAVIEAFMEAFRQDNDKRASSIALQRTLYGIVKRATGDFVTGGVYGIRDPIRITTAGQLVQAVTDNPMGYYLLENDIDFADLTADQGAYIAARFLGTLDGNGHSLTGVSHTLFKEMIYGQIINLTVESPSYSGDTTAYLALSAKNTVLENVKVQNADLNLPLVKQKSGGYYEWGDVGTTIGQKTISSPEELLAIGSADTTRKMDYRLTEDLDLSGMVLDGAAIRGTFSGKLDGGGHTIRGLTAPLFETVDSAEVKNLTLADAAVTGNNYKGLLANTLSNSRVTDFRITGSTLTNNSNQVGMLAGLTRASTLERITLSDITVAANNTVGGLAGQMDGTALTDCLVTGSVSGTLNNNLGSRAGGITGWLSSNSTLQNCYVRAAISGAQPKGNGGLIGGPDAGSASIRNAVSLSTGANAFRLSGFPVLGLAENVFELADSDSQTNIDETNADRVFAVTAGETRDPAFYTGRLGWSEEVWDFSAVSGGGTPRLR